MAEVTITTVDSGYDIIIQPTEITLGEVTISGIGPKGDQGEKGDKGDAAAIADVVGLQAALDSKAAAVHYHILDDITDFNGSVMSGGTF